MKFKFTSFYLQDSQNAVQTYKMTPQRVGKRTTRIAGNLTSALNSSTAALQISLPSGFMIPGRITISAKHSVRHVNILSRKPKHVLENRPLIRRLHARHGLIAKKTGLLKIGAQAKKRRRIIPIKLLPAKPIIAHHTKKRDRRHSRKPRKRLNILRIGHKHLTSQSTNSIIMRPKMFNQGRPQINGPEAQIDAIPTSQQRQQRKSNNQIRPNRKLIVDTPTKQHLKKRGQKIKQIIKKAHKRHNKKHDMRPLKKTEPSNIEAEDSTTMKEDDRRLVKRFVKHSPKRKIVPKHRKLKTRPIQAIKRHNRNVEAKKRPKRRPINSSSTRTLLPKLSFLSSVKLLPKFEAPTNMPAPNNPSYLMGRISSLLSFTADQKMFASSLSSSKTSSFSIAPSSISTANKFNINE